MRQEKEEAREGRGKRRKRQEKEEAREGWGKRRMRQKKEEAREGRGKIRKSREKKAKRKSQRKSKRRRQENKAKGGNRRRRQVRTRYLQGQPRVRQGHHHDDWGLQLQVLECARWHTHGGFDNLCRVAMLIHCGIYLKKIPLTPVSVKLTSDRVGRS